MGGGHTLIHIGFSYQAKVSVIMMQNAVKGELVAHLRYKKVEFVVIDVIA